HEKSTLGWPCSSFALHTEITKACVAGFVLPPGAYLRHLHHSDGSSSQGKFNLSDLFCARNGFRTRS
ncbi:TPA: hypothetical protein ACWYJ6_004779, partial [Klebsiella pneumoniae]